MQKKFFEKCLFEYKHQYAVKKKHNTNFGAIPKALGKFFVVAIKKMLVKQFPYIEIV